MSLLAGTRLGPYEILSAVGAGGMGEVYRARDSRLGRDIAIKVLPAAFSADPERLTRFEQEARSAAALNHPNILAVHDIGQHNGAPYIVSELLEGETLRERLHGGAIPVRKAVEYAVQIAHGLAAAHEKGIVHRDLKPENVFVIPDGHVKILDFGLAKLTQVEPALAGASALPTTPPNTQAGVVLGTIGYMSPEQVRGLPADSRSDIFALGVVLYEMLSGKQAFHGDTAMDAMTAILKEDPPALPIAERHIPPALVRIVDRCLEKSPAARFQSARDLAFALEALSQSSSGLQSTDSTSPMPGRRIRISWAVAASFAVISAALGVAAGRVLWRVTPPAPAPIRLSFSRPAGTTLTNTGRPVLTISPDGTKVVFTSNYQLYVRKLDAAEAQPIGGTESTGLTTPFFSPDSRWVAFFEEGSLKKIPVDGGVAVVICTVAGGNWGASWGADGRIVFATADGIFRVAATGGTPEKIVGIKPGEAFHGPQMLPDGQYVLLTVTTAIGPGRWDKGEIVAQSVSSADRRVLIQGGRDARYLATGHLVYVVGTTLFAVAVDVNALQVRGTPVAIQRGVEGATETTAAAYFAVSLTGHLAYIPVSDSAPAGTEAFVDLSGRLEPLSVNLRSPRISPNGSQITSDVGSAVWIYQGLTMGYRESLPLRARVEMPYGLPTARE